MSYHGGGVILSAKYQDLYSTIPLICTLTLVTKVL